MLHSIIQIRMRLYKRKCVQLIWNALEEAKVDLVMRVASELTL
jgi:hypothetical protein